jgi:hypothetical protein
MTPTLHYFRLVQQQLSLSEINGSGGIAVSHSLHAMASLLTEDERRTRGNKDNDDDDDDDDDNNDDNDDDNFDNNKAITPPLTTPTPAPMDVPNSDPPLPPTQSQYSCLHVNIASAQREPRLPPRRHRHIHPSSLSCQRPARHR